MNSALNTYQVQQIKNATPNELIGILYDMAIQSTYRKDQVRLIKILTLLMRSLNHDYEVSESFFTLYEYCQHIARDNKFEEVRDLLSGVRDAWYENVIKGNKSVMQAAV